MTKIARGSDRLQCSFCLKGPDDVRKLIAGHGAYICDECVGLCRDILAEELVVGPRG